jgi:hypothetical protein
MRRNLIFLSLTVSLSLIACGGNKETAQAQTKAGSSKESVKNDISYIKMHRSACFGRCPDYFVELYGDGLVRYTGRYFVADSGIYEKRYPVATVQQLFNEFSEKRVDTCRDAYDVTISDFPGISYWIEYGDKKKEIKNAHFGPRFLKHLAGRIDEVIKVDRSWTKISEGHKGD